MSGMFHRCGTREASAANRDKNSGDEETILLAQPHNLFLPEIC